MGRMSRIVIVVGLACLVGQSGCKKPKQFVLTRQQEAKVANAILSEAPKPQITLNAELDGKIRLLGVDIEPASDKLKAGGQVRLTFYWECLQEISDDTEWMIFIHLEAPVSGGGVTRLNGDHHAVEDKPMGKVGLYPISQWKKGQIIKDTKTMKLATPDKRPVGPGPAVIYTGVFDATAWRLHQQDVRMTLSNTAPVKSDGKGRLEVARFKIGGRAAPVRTAKPKELQVRRAIGEIIVDGKLDEVTWRAALPSPVFRQANGQPAGRDLFTQVKLLWDDKALYAGYTVHDEEINTPYSNRDDHLWKADCIEMFLDPGMDSKNYIELQVSPKNVVFDALFKTHKSPHFEESKKWNLPGLKTAVHAGILGRGGRTKKGWTVEVAIPWSGLTSADAAKPSEGSQWKANFFRMEKREKGMGATAWSAAADFHDFSKAGLIRFVSTPEQTRTALVKKQKEATGKAAVPVVPTAVRAKTAPAALVPIKAVTKPAREAAPTTAAPTTTR